PFALPFPFRLPFLTPFPPLRCVTPADLRAYDRRGWTARSIASGMRRCRRRGVPFLKEMGASSLGTDVGGRTPLVGIMAHPAVACHHRVAIVARPACAGTPFRLRSSW